MTRSLFIASLFSIFLLNISCSSDDSKKATDDDPQNLNTIITTEIGNSIAVPIDPSGNTYSNIYTTPLDENKYTINTLETFVNDVLENTTINIEYEYDNAGFLTNLNTSNTVFSREYTYDQNNIIIAGTLFLDNGAANHYRFVNPSNNIYYHERLTALYNDPSTELIRRVVLELNDAGQIISAGRDSDFDGVAENLRTFTYSEEGNLLTATDNTQTITIAYSDIIDTAHFIQTQMLGTKNISIINGETYGILSLEDISDINNSYHLSTDEATKASYQTNEEGFYTEKIFPEEVGSNFITTRSVQYIFE